MWIIYSLLVFFSSNLLYLTIRKAQKTNIAIEIYSAAMFSIPALFYFFLSIINRTPLLLSIPNFLLVIFAAFFWSYLGNYFSQKGVFYAPNPGYSLILQKSYVVLTTVTSVFLFGSEFSYSKAIAIIIILIFSFLASLSPESKKSENKWIYYSVGAHLCFAFGSLISKHFLNLGLIPYVYLFYINTFVGLVNFSRIKDKKSLLSLSKFQYLFLLVIGLSSIGFNLFMQMAYKSAPNPGYVAAINTSSIMSLTLLSALIYKDNLSKTKIIAIIGILVGLLILTFS